LHYGFSVSLRKAAVAESSLECAVFVEACGSGWEPQTAVRHLVWYEGRVHEEIQVFPSLREALAYAQKACVSPNGPRL
jgi:hypothetical protein